MENVSIKDFIIDVKDLGENNISKSAKTKTPTIKFELELETETDFVIRRTTAKTEKQLVYFVGKGLYYIKNLKNDEIKILNKSNITKELGSFFKNYDDNIRFEKLQWAKEVNKYLMIEILEDSKCELLIKHGLSNYIDSYYSKEIADLLDKNPKLLKLLLNSNNKSYNRYFFNSVFTINDCVDFNNAKYLIEIQKDIKMKFEYGANYYIKYLIEKFQFDVNTLLEYITYGFKSQGIEEIDNSNLILFKDYLVMQKSMYGKIKDKYSKTLKTDHDRLVMKYNLWRKYKNDSKILEHSEKYNHLLFNDKDYSILLPTTTSDIVDEGMNLSHCVASYVNKVINDETTILFMRDNNAIDESLITIEVRNDEIIQVRGFGNRKPNKDEVKFIKKWAKNKKIKFVN